MTKKIKSLRFVGSIVFVGLALLIYSIWHNRHRWGWTATWISGLITSMLGFMNSNAAALGVLFTLAFGLLNWLEKRKVTQATIAAAEAGTLHAGDAQDD